MNSFQRWIAKHSRTVDIRLAIIPCAVTIIGAALSFAWLARLVPWWTGALGLGLDCVDGALARKLEVPTEYGSLLDWTVDVILCAGALALTLPTEHAILAIVAILPIQVGLRQMEVRFCGRALLFLILLGREALQ